MSTASQSPRIGAVLPATQSSGTAATPPSRNPLESGQSFRRMSTPSSGCGRLESQSPRIGAVLPARLRPLWANRGLSRNPLKSGQSFRRKGTVRLSIAAGRSQSPQIGSVIPAKESRCVATARDLSQSPQIGSVIPACGRDSRERPANSRNPLKSGQSFRQSKILITKGKQWCRNPLKSGQSFRQSGTI